VNLSLVRLGHKLDTRVGVGPGENTSLLISWSRGPTAKPKSTGRNRRVSAQCRPRYKSYPGSPCRLRISKRRFRRKPRVRRQRQRRRTLLRTTNA